MRRLLWLVVSLCSSEDVDVNSLVKFWLQSHTPSTEPPPSFESLISDHFYLTLEWVLSAGNQVVVVNGLTHVRTPGTEYTDCVWVDLKVGWQPDIGQKS